MVRIHHLPPSIKVQMSHNPTDFYSRTLDASKILVVDLGFLGDTVHLVPALWEIKDNYPQAALHVLTSSVGEDLLKLAPCADRVWAIVLDPARRSLRQQWRIVAELRRERFDVAFNFMGADRTLFMTALSGARWRVAHQGGRKHFWNRWLVPEWVPRQNPDLTVFEQRRQVLAACGLKLGHPRFDLKIDERSANWAADVVPPIAIHVSVNSSKAVREWPLDHYVALFRALWAKNPALCVLASGSSQARERERLRLLAERTNDARLQVLPAGLTIPQLAAVLTRCRLHLGPDSGVLHLAAALHLPTVSFFREQGAYKSFFPVGNKHQIITVPCSCVDHRQSPCERIGQGECFARIEPARVADLVRQSLADIA
jgi:heptosyltransferase-3